MKRLAEKIEELRINSHMSQKALGELIGIEQSRFSELKSGKWKPTIVPLLLLARALGTTMEFLVDDEMNDPPRLGLQGSEDERLILKLAEDMGYDEARRRLALTKIRVTSEEENLPHPYRR